MNNFHSLCRLPSPVFLDLFWIFIGRVFRRLAAYGTVWLSLSSVVGVALQAIRASPGQMDEPSIDLQQVVPPDLPGHGPVVLIGEPGTWLSKRAIYLQMVSLPGKIR